MDEIFEAYTIIAGWKNIRARLKLVSVSLDNAFK